MDINVKEMLPKRQPKIQDGVLALNNNKKQLQKLRTWNGTQRQRYQLYSDIMKLS